MKKVINFIAPKQTPDAYEKLTDAIARDLCYEQTKDWLSELGYYLPEDQFLAIKSLFDSQMNLEIGSRKGELQK